MDDVEVKLSCLKNYFKKLPKHFDRNDNWKVIGQEQDGALLISWISSSCNQNEAPCTVLSLFDVTDAEPFKILIKLDGIQHVIQASVNASRTILVFVTKEKEFSKNDNKKDNGENVIWYYRTSLLVINNGKVTEVEAKKTMQTMAQFLYRKKGTSPERFLVLTHQECVKLYQIEEEREHVEDENEIDSAPIIEIKELLIETIVKAFCWAQWDALHQSLYVIHYRKPPPVAVEGEYQDETIELAPTLSALQFHDDMPHETVLNTPLNLPGMSDDVNIIDEVIYEDDALPLRVHDQSLDVFVVCDSKGILCICHYYLYQPVQPPASDIMCESQTVHFAYSVTLLHHGKVVHFDMPGVPLLHASTLRPTFTMQGDQHLIVYTPGLFVHLLDIGSNHEPCCHIVLNNFCKISSMNVLSSSRFVKLLTDMPSFYSEKICAENILINLETLDIVTLHVTTKHLISAYKCESSILENKLAILHYFLIHVNDPNVLYELLIPLAENCVDLNLPKLMQEVLVGSAYSSTLKGLSCDAVSLLHLLPFTTYNSSIPMQIKVPGTRLNMTLKQENLWNPSVMLLSPRQRLMPYRADMWTALWDALSAPRELRFKPGTVAEKLMVSLVCYQPEALSRCSTPLSPGGPLGSGGTLSDLAMITGNRTKQITDPLPFYEVESSAASKQEHVISVNLREVSMHLLKHGKGVTSPMQVHAVATRYAAAQLESSYHLCHLVSKSCAIDTKHQERGFPLIDNLDEGKRRVLFALMERYNLAIEILAFPLPQGFPSFMAYLGYRTLSFPMFLQYVQASVLQLQVDVMKAIMADLSDNGEGLTKKLRLIQMLPRSRGKRLMNQWSHPASLMIRAREHALNILSGVEGVHARGYPNRHKNQLINSKGLAAFPSDNRLSPLDTFLDLLTAKASLAELDFTLLIDATMTSTEDFID